MGGVLPGPGDNPLSTSAGIGTVISALLMGAAQVIGVARNPVRLEQVRALDPRRISTISLSRGESITQKVQELTGGQGASVLADVAPAGAETMMECMKNLEAGGSGDINRC